MRDKTVRISNLDYIRIASAICIVLHHYHQFFDIRFQWINFYEEGFRLVI
jgi:hypothetical protein